MAKTVIVRLFLALVASNNLFLHQLDMNNSFLHEVIHEDIYMKPPLGYSLGDKGQVCKLQRILYGLKQASRQWNIELTDKLQHIGFHQSSHDNCLFVCSFDAGFIALLVYIGDILLASSNILLINEVKEYLHNEFTIKDLGVARYFLGLELARSPQGLYINERKYGLDLINDARLSGAKPLEVPMVR